MNKKDLDRFESSVLNSSIMDDSEGSYGENNFFINNNLKLNNEPQFYQAENPLRRLNDYDSALLERNSYKEISDEILKLEYKISSLEEEISTLEAQVNMSAELFDDEESIGLLQRKNILEKERYELLQIYNEKSLSAKMTESVTGLFKNNKSKQEFKAKKFLSKFSKFIENLLPQNVISLLELKNSLKKLESINKTVDDLVSMNVPYGEDFKRYEQLSKYIIKANSIHNKINQDINSK